MKLAFASALLAAGVLAGCAGSTPTPSMPRNNDREQPLPPGEGMFGRGLTWERGDSKPATPPAAAPAAPMTASEQEEFKKWQESAGATERSEFEDWRAWQEWKRKNPK
jgi:hypothetical protein